MGSNVSHAVAKTTQTRATRALLGFLAAWPFGSAVVAHEVPVDITVQVIVQPVGEHLQLLVRVPLEAMQDIDFPTTGPGYLDTQRADEQLHNAALLWLANDIDLYEAGKPLARPALIAVRASIPSDRSFSEYATALAHVQGPPLPAGTQLFWKQAMLDALFEIPIRSAASEFAIRARFDRLGQRTVTVVRFATPQGAVRVFQLAGNAGLVQLDPRWHQAMFRFVREGFLHILDGVDHLLFLLCLVLRSCRNIRALVGMVTAFTVAHSITLVGSAYGLAPDALWFAPLIEVLIAASIFYMAIENVVSEKVRARWLIAFGFGLIHGFGFSFALRNTLQFAGTHVLVSLLSFNLGVELGQLLVLLVLVPLLLAVFRFGIRERVTVIVVSVIAAHTAWHWMTERFAILRQFPIRWIDVRTAFAASGLGWLAIAACVAGLAWFATRKNWAVDRRL